MTLQPSLPRPKKPNLFIIRRVVGTSMQPTLVPGALVIAVRPHHVRIDDVVVLRHNGIEKIKRVKDIQQGEVFVVGDNAETSTDSRIFGWLSHEHIIAKIIWPRVTRP